MVRRAVHRQIHCVIARSLCVFAAAAVGTLLSAAAASASPHKAAPKAATAATSVNVSNATVGPGVPAGFVGLATEYWNVEAEVGTDPTKPDSAFEQAARNLAPYGGLSLRIGGDSTDWTWFPIPGMKQPPWVRWVLTPTWTAVTKRLVSDLHANLIVGLNMEADNVRIADAELHEIEAGIGNSAPITFELGNEPELYNHFAFYHTANGAAVLGRPKSYSLADMAAEWDQMANRLPSVRLAGPGYSGLNALPYVGGFLSSTKRLKLLTVHTYPLKSKRCTGKGDLQESDLFEPQSIQGMAAQVSAWTSLAHHYGDGVRVDEMNSVTCGGQPGLSNTFGPALWALNILPLYATAGINGVNIQTRPAAPQNPSAQNLIQTNFTSAGWRVFVQPEYYGLLAFSQLTPPGSRILKVGALNNGLYAWAVRTPQGQTHVVITNVGSSTASVSVKASGASGKATVEALKASGGLTTSTGASLGGQTISPQTGQLSGPLVTSSVSSQHGAYDVTVPAASAQIVTFKG